MDRRNHGLAATVVLLSSLCGCRANPDRRIEPPTPEPPRMSEQIVSLGRSVKGMDIRATIFGSGQRRVLILGGIHGDEVTSVDVARDLVATIRRDPLLLGNELKLVVIEVANPDGYASKTRSNAHGIDCNRNFPATNFKPGGRAPYRAGTSAASEPETLAIMRAIDEFKPVLLISIHSITQGRECNNFDGPGAAFAQAMSRVNGYPAESTIGYPTPGSLGSYAGIDRQIPMVTLELPRRAEAAEVINPNRDALLAAIRLAR